MRFDVITLFPELYAAHLVHGVTRRAFESGQVEVRLWPLRDFGDAPHARVDDRPYGGGPGMVLLVEPLERALAAIRAARAEQAPAPLINFSPAGELVRQETVVGFASGAGAILLCARYEGVDQRFIDAHVDLELSVGDYVLSGGDLPALVLLDAVARLQRGVLGDARSHEQDSFSAGLLDCPHYSRPERLGSGPAVGAIPDVLLSGNHAAIERWRREQSLLLTAERRPDLLDAARASGRLEPADLAFLAQRRARKL
ncbi:MAG: tRNA (guanosine(37)-N1)-methyltransferase TrmD [Caldimonas sp.]